MGNNWRDGVSHHIRMGEVQVECQVCDFWIVLHGNEGNIDYSDERFKKCQKCTRIERINAYKEFWNQRSK